MIGCLRTRVRNQPIIALYFESENVLKLYNLEAWFCDIACCFHFNLCRNLAVEVRAGYFSLILVLLLCECRYLSLL